MEWMLMPLKRYAEFSGRSRRKEYWMFVLLQVLIYIAFLILMMLLGGGAMMMVGSDPTAAAGAGGAALALMAIYGLVSLALLIPGLAVTVRRLHDTDRSGWWLAGLIGLYVLMFVTGGMAVSSGDPAGGGGALTMILSLVILVYAITMLVFMVLDGTKGPNKYGPDPKGGVDADKVFA